MTKKNYILINPPRYEIVPEYFPMYLFRKTMIRLSQPAGLLRIGTYLRDQGHHVSMINCGVSAIESETPCMKIGERIAGNFDRKNGPKVPLFYFGMSYGKFKNKLREERYPDEIIVSSFFTYQWEPVHEVIKVCKAVFPKAIVRLGGTYATLCPEHAKKSQADVIFKGEFVETNNAYSGVDLMEKTPDYCIIKLTRGCPLSCSYCAVPGLEGHKMRYRGPDDVFDEICEKVEKYKIRRFVFFESSLLYDFKNRLEPLIDLILKNNMDLEIAFPEGLTPKLLKPEILIKLNAVGIESINLAVESSNDDISKERFGRKNNFHDFEEVVTFMRDNKISVPICAFVLAGMPDYPIRQVKNTLSKILSFGRRILPILQPFTPIPTTAEYRKYHHRFQHKGLEDLHPFLWPCVTSQKEYDELCYLYSCCISITENSNFVSKKRLEQTIEDKSNSGSLV